MNKNLILTSTKGMEESEWLQLRQGGIGGSEVGTVMFQNDFESQLELYHRKIGMSPLEKEENESMFWGKEHEATIAKNWQYFDGTTKGMITNRRRGKEFIFRKCRNYNYLVRNIKYPYLLGNIDRLINKGQVRVFDGQILEKEGLLEIKTVKEWAMKMWEAGIPNTYILQMISYMAICELDYAEMTVLMSNARLDIIPIEFNQQIFDNILDAVNPFWEKVLTGRLLLRQYEFAQKTGDMDFMAEKKFELDRNEPEVTEGDAIQREKYLNKKYLAVPETVEGTEVEFEAAIAYRKILAKEKELEQRKAFNATIMKNFLKEATVLDFGDNGQVTWNADKRGIRSLKMNKLVA